jgi:hypothetical protein
VSQENVCGCELKWIVMDTLKLKDFSLTQIEFLEKSRKWIRLTNEQNVRRCSTPLITLVYFNFQMLFFNFSSLLSRFQLVEISSKIKQSITIHKWINILILTCEVSIIHFSSLLNYFKSHFLTEQVHRTKCNLISTLFKKNSKFLITSWRDALINDNFI